MKKKTIWNRSVSLFLSFCMVFGLAVMMPAAALADDRADAGGEETAKTRNSAEYDYMIRAIDGDEPANDPPTVITPVSASENGVLVEAYSAYTAALRITEEGGISVSAGEIGATVKATDGGTAKLTLDGPLVSGDVALDVSASANGNVVLKTGALTTNSGGDGIRAEATGEGTVDIRTGSITAQGTGVSVTADDGSKVNVQAGGAVNAGKDKDGVFILSEGKGTEVTVYATQEVNAGHEGVEIKASEGGYAGGMIGSVKSSGENAFGVWIKTDDSVGNTAAAAIPDKLSSIFIDPDAEEGSSWHSGLIKAGSAGSAAQVALDTGDVTAYAGIHVEANGGVAGIETGKVTVTEGNIKDDEIPVEDRFANGFIATDGGMVVGDLDSVSSKACGVDLYIRSSGAAAVNTGKIEADQIGVHIDNESGKTWTDVETVTSKMEDIC